MTPDQVGSHLERYLDLRRALGSKMDAQVSRLRDFVAFIEARRLDGPGMAQGALDWACSSSRTCGPAGQAHRLSLARMFLSHLRAIDPQIRVPEPGLLPRSVRPKPYIYSDGEIEALVTSAKSLGPQGSLRPHTYTTLIGLLVSCGLRISEALRLHVSQVELEAHPPLCAYWRPSSKSHGWFPSTPPQRRLCVATPVSAGVWPMGDATTSSFRTAVAPPPTRPPSRRSVVWFEAWACVVRSGVERASTDFATRSSSNA